MVPTSTILLLLATRYCAAFSAIAVPGAVNRSPLAGFDYSTNDKIPWSQDGYQTWKWNDHDINYIEMGDSSKPPLLLIHGFGASAYHFRYNIPVLARDYHVFAFDMLGFGLSSKPIQEYPAEVWRDQTVAFIRDVIGKPVTVAGNSLGGFTALYAAASLPDLIPACILLNSAGSFRNPEAQVKAPPPAWLQSIQNSLERFVIGLSFLYTKQPSRIQEVLKQVYPVSSDQVDDELVESIRIPSLDPNAPEVFFQVVSKSTKRQTFVDDLLERIECPVLLCWGERDPWIRPAAADKMEKIYANCKRVSIDAGHCPHDEAPAAVNAAIREFMDGLN
ncbi:Serine aminopeptidase [Fragilaria crotonensis]|nr:Serine aminopeptidase [Fragilaria crotonensis]